MLKRRIAEMFDSNMVISGVQGKYGFVYNTNGSWVKLLKENGKRVRTIQIKKDGIVKHLGENFLDLDLTSQIKIVQRVFNKAEGNNFELEKYYIFTNVKTIYVNSLEELFTEAIETMKVEQGYVAVGLEYSKLNGIEGIEGIGGYDILIKQEGETGCTLNLPEHLRLTPEQKKFICIDLYNEINK